MGGSRSRRRRQSLIIRNRLEAAAQRRGLHLTFRCTSGRKVRFAIVAAPPQFTAYRATSQQVMHRLHALTPLVEQSPIDESFVEVTALDEPDDVLAAQLQATIRDDLALSCSLGVATNKLVAKVATDVVKSLVQNGRMPQAICVVPLGEEAIFLARLPATALWGIGPGLLRNSLHSASTRSATLPPGLPLISHGASLLHGEDLTRRARGSDTRPIVMERAAKSISQETTFARDVTDCATL